MYSTEQCPAPENVTLVKNYMATFGTTCDPMIDQGFTYDIHSDLSPTISQYLTWREFTYIDNSNQTPIAGKMWRRGTGSPLILLILPSPWLLLLLLITLNPLCSKHHATWFHVRRMVLASKITFFRMEAYECVVPLSYSFNKWQMRATVFKGFVSMYLLEMIWEWWDGVCHNFWTSLKHIK